MPKLKQIANDFCNKLDNIKKIDGSLLDCASYITHRFDRSAIKQYPEFHKNMVIFASLIAIGRFSQSDIDSELTLHACCRYNLYELIDEVLVPWYELCVFSNYNIVATMISYFTFGNKTGIDAEILFEKLLTKYIVALNKDTKHEKALQ